MKVIVAGTRTLADPSIVNKAIEQFTTLHGPITEVVYGGAEGADALGKKWADAHAIPVVPFFPNWKKYWKQAGPKRNEHMAQYAHALVACWNGTSRGTADMVRRMQRLGKPVLVVRY